MPYFYDWTYILIIPGLLLSLWAQFRVQSAFSKYSKVRTHAGEPACRVVSDMLSRNNNGGVNVEQVSGSLTDHFDPKTDTLRLSSSVYASDSVAALGIAAHEAGHAMQKLDDYGPLSLRTAVVPIVNIGSNLAVPIFILGLIVSWEPLMLAGIICFALVVAFTLVTLPVEFNASRRAIAMLTAGGYISADEEKGVRAVLSAAAMTYVASAISAILQLVRLLALANSRRRD